ncbi:class-II aminoacyl-tRNA synthetase family protein [Enterococcus rivorum]|uniref:Aminoacyl-transfer RNA synthetases class-II family profile domain-containing protein n=1 Tax=Enterococcus rivorum TaxID=762845 RepID=A0A1E5KUC0_9ENTE|nr:hypothetical protein [Enterococcus rivorum]MBP2098940.1 seryl-tRNA synthetase [Enterococcus rivorum]OEH81463.1 hypothetical protein BCR26_04240 [Enterococcus rivorum]
MIHPEYATLHSKDTELRAQLNIKLMSYIKDYKVNEWTIPSLIDGDVLERCGYFSTIPNQLTKIGTLDLDKIDLHAKDNDCNGFISSSNLYLTPAACIHFYPMLETENKYNEIITTMARVYRYEDGAFVYNERQWEFSVREFVAVGSIEYVQNFLEDMKSKLLEYAQQFTDKSYLKVAHDHFYPSKKNALKEKFQEKNKLKTELVADINGKNVSIASFNFHGYHFSKEFNFDSNGNVVSGCVGCGIDRWLELIHSKN